MEVRDVRVKFTSSQEQSGHRDSQSKIVNGKLYERRGAVCLQFRDDMDTEEIVCVVEVTDAQVVIRRSGAVSSEMTFILGKSEEFRHKNAFGCVYFSMQTKELETSVTPESLKLRIVYDLSSNSTVISTNTIMISAS